jgi:hypothetical protein
MVGSSQLDWEDAREYDLDQVRQQGVTQVRLSGLKVY